MEIVNFYAVVGPAVLILIACEVIYCLVKKNGYYSFQDSLMGLGTMIIAQCVNVALTYPILVGYGWIYENFSLFTIPATFWSLVLCYLGVDFLFYWFHRAGHRVNILWAAHVPHHSAEELNYAVALRASLTQRIASFLFYWPLAWLGFSPETIIPIVALNLILQLLPHTRVIPKLPTWIDSWLNTPYHHRIHHAANPIYWDKNYGGTFIFWDRIFGTFEPETEVPYYGVSIHPRSWDPTYLNFHWYWVLFQDARAATHWVDKIKIWFKPPGWRPRNLGPYEKKDYFVDGVQQKYQTQALPGSSGYLLLQAIFAFGMLYLVIDPKSPISTPDKWILSGLLYLSVTLWAGILESKRWALPLELLRILLFAGFIGAILREHPLRFESVAWIGLAVLALSTLWVSRAFIQQKKRAAPVGATLH